MLDACRAADAVLLGAVGGPKWDTTDPDAPRPEQGLLGLRKGMGLYANLRPVRPSPALVDASPLREERIAGTDLLVVRELTGGIYFGDSGRDGDTRPRHLRVLGRRDRADRPRRLRGGAAPRRGLGRTPGSPRSTRPTCSRPRASGARWSTGVAADYPDVELDHLLVDNAAMQLVSRPADFDVIVTENLFGDILSDESAMLTGSLGMLPSASLGADGGPGLFEPVHGSAPDIAGQGDRQPARDLPLGGDDAAPRPRPARRGRRGSRPRSTPCSSAACAPPTWPGASPAPRSDAVRGRGRHRGDDATPCSRQLLDSSGPLAHRAYFAAMETAELIWQNGEFVPWEDAKVHVLSHGLHYGTGVFEGIRCYETERGPAIFRHRDHLDRLAKSAELYYLRAALLGRGARARRPTS